MTFIIPPSSIPATNQPGQVRQVMAPDPPPPMPQPVVLPVMGGGAELQIDSLVSGTGVSPIQLQSVINATGSPTIDTSGGWDNSTWAPGVAGDYACDIWVELTIVNNSVSIPNPVFDLRLLAFSGSQAYSAVPITRFFSIEQAPLPLNTRFGGSTVLYDVPADAIFEFMIAMTFHYGTDTVVEVNSVEISMSRLS